VSRRPFALHGWRASRLTLRSALSVAAIFWIAAAAAEPLMFDIAQAELAYDPRSGVPVVSFRFTPDSARKFAQLTLQNVGHVIEMRVDGKVLSRPVIREPILGGSGQISGPLNVQEARDLAARLASGTQLEIEAVAN
jgi:preprotein translocase subunit SecD